MLGLGRGLEAVVREEVEGVELRQMFIQPKEGDVARVSLEAARMMFRELKTEEDLAGFESLAPGSCNSDALFAEIKSICCAKAGISAEEMDSMIGSAEKDMARLYLEATLSTSPLTIETPRLRVSTDVTSRRFSQSSGTSSLRIEEQQRYCARVASLSSSEFNDDEESIPSEHTTRGANSPQASYSSQSVSWANLPPSNRAPDTETQEGISEESDSRNELIFIEYSHLSPRNAPNQQSQMMQIAEAIDEEEAKTQIGPCFVTTSPGSEYVEAFRATTPKFRCTPLCCDAEESRSRPMTFASGDFSSVRLESVTHSPRLPSPRALESPSLDSEFTQERISEEPKINFVPEWFSVSNMVIDMEKGDRAGRRTCSAPCSLL
jgi:hypothetical protein